MTTKKGLGWHKDPPDKRDLLVTALLKGNTAPDQVNWRQFCPPVKDQLYTSTCVGQAAAIAFTTVAAIEKHKWDTSELFGYFIARYQHGAHNQDQGTGLRYLYKAVRTHGICPANSWPFDPHNWGSPGEFIKKRINKDPDFAAYRKAFDQRWLAGYYRIESVSERIDQMKQALHEKGIINFGINVGAPFMDYTGGVIDNLGPSLGGHAMTIYGYYKNEYWLVQNSWGSNWGESGHCKLSMRNAHQMRDIWVVKHTPRYSGT